MWKNNVLEIKPFNQMNLNSGANRILRKTEASDANLLSTAHLDSEARLIAQELSNDDETDRLNEKD